MVCVASPFPHENRPPSFGDTRTPAAQNGHLIPRIDSVCVHGDDPRRTHLRAQRGLSQTSPSQLAFFTNFQATTLQITSWTIAQDHRAPGQTIAAFPHGLRMFSFTVLPFSTLQWPHLSTGRSKSEKSEVEYVFVARRGILKRRERVPVACSSRTKRYAVLVHLLDVPY